MDSEQSDIVVTEIEADLTQARRTSIMAHSVVIMLQEMGLPQDMNDDLSSVCTDLGDIWGAQQEFTDRLQNMIKADRSWEMVGDALTDLRASMDHVAWHLKSVREPLTRIAEFAYGQENDTPRVHRRSLHHASLRSGNGSAPLRGMSPSTQLHPAGSC